jgi:hypothetical protein
VEPEEMFVARRRPGEEVSAATDAQATVEELLETMFSIRSVQSDYKRRPEVCKLTSRLEAGSNTSTIVL